jgi:ABC-2 type transport system permease protein
MRGSGAVLRKEAGDLVRGRRLAVFVLVLSGILAIPYAILSNEIATSGGTSPPRYGDVFTPIVLAGPIAVLLLALALGSDALSRERDEGTLVLLATSPASRAGIWAGKLGGALLAYAAVAAVTLLFLAPWAWTHGGVNVEAAAWVLAIPFLVLYLALLGVGFLLSTVLSTSRASIGAALGIDLGMFLLQLEEPGLGGFLVEFAPAVRDVLRYNPFEVGAVAARALRWGQPLPWPRLGAVLMMAAVLLGASLWVFRASEVHP